MSNIISLCMIVKNEEAVLERCLSSVIDWVDEIVIVDTGSTDSTKEIAQRYTDKVIDFEWCDDFSAARNAALSHATGQWILHLDADEYMEPLTRDEVHQKLLAVTTDQPQGFSLTIYNLLDGNGQNQWLISSNLRLFSNDPQVRYTRPIHELISYQGNALPNSSLPFKIYHTGYLTETYTNKQKNNRNLAIFNKYRQKGSKDPIDNFYLGNEYYAQGDIEKAAYYYKRAYEHRRKKLPWFHHAAIRYTHVLLHLNRTRDAIQVVNESIELWPEFPDFYCHKAHILASTGLEEEALRLYRYCLEMSEDIANKQQNFWLISPEYGSSIPYEYMASIFARQLDFTEQVACLTKLVQMNSKDPKYWYNLLLVLASRESNEAALQFLKNYSGTKDARFFRQILHVSFLLKSDAIGSYAEEQLVTDCNEKLSGFEKMYLALLKRNAEVFRHEWGLMQTSPQLAGAEWAEPLLIGALIFDDAEIMKAPSCNMPQSVRDLSDQWFHIDPDADHPHWNDRVIDTLKSLFLMGEIELYNRLFQRYAVYESTLSSALADFLFDLGQYESAFTYYADQMDKQELRQDGYVRLIRYYFHFLQDRETARQMAEEAVARYPQSFLPYFYLIRHLTNESERGQWLNRLQGEVSLPIPFSEIRSLL